MQHVGPERQQAFSKTLDVQPWCYDSRLRADHRNTFSDTQNDAKSQHVANGAVDNRIVLTLRVGYGDSMTPEFNEGDLIVVDPERRAANGSYIIAKNGKGEATFKKLAIDGSSVFLKPLNERYPIKDMTGVEFKIIGVVSEKRKRY